MTGTGSKSERAQQMRYVSVIQNSVFRVDSRVDGYRRALQDAVVDILALERAHAQTRTNITQQIAGKVEALGAFLVQHSWTEEDGERA